MYKKEENEWDRKSRMAGRRVEGRGGRHTGPHVLHMQQLNTDKGADCWVRFYLFLVFFLE